MLFACLFVVLFCAIYDFCIIIFAIIKRVVLWSTGSPVKWFSRGYVCLQWESVPVGLAQKVDPAHNGAQMRTNALDANSKIAKCKKQIMHTNAVVANGYEHITTNAMHLNAVVANVGYTKSCAI